MSKKSTLSGPRVTTIKRLFAASGNRCAFPGCTSKIVVGDIVVGDVCHIEGANAGSARYREEQVPEERHGFENLLVLCKLHHTTVDGDEDTYTTVRLKEIKRSHEAVATTLPKVVGDTETSLFIAHIEAKTVTAQTVNVATMNVLPPRQTSSDTFEPGDGPLSILAPELGRVLARQIYALDRAITQFSVASSCNAPPSDSWITFRPSTPALYPNAHVCLELSHGDAALLSEFYTGTKEIDEVVCRWHEQISVWDMNMWNVLMQKIGTNVEIGIQATKRFCPSRLYDSRVPVLGTFSERGAQSLKNMQSILAVHLERFSRLHAAKKVVREFPKSPRQFGDPALNLSQLVGGSRTSWMAAIEAAVRCSVLPLDQTDAYYQHRLHNLTRDEIALLWIELARQRMLSLDDLSRPDPVAIFH